MSKNKSFTIIELLITIVIIGILAGIIIVSTTSSITKANFAKAKAFSSNIQNSMLLNLVSEWTFDEPEEPGRITKDSWGSNHGTVSGATYKDKDSGECVFGGCYSFDGDDDYIDCGKNSIFNFKTSNFLFSTWFKTNNSTKRQYLMGFGGISSPNLQFDMNDEGYGLWVYWNGGGSPRARTTINYGDNKWHFMVFMRNFNTFSLIIDNTKITENYTSSIDLSELNFILGRGGSSGEYFNGLIDDTRIYNEAMSNSKIKQNYIIGMSSLLEKGLLSKQEYDQRIESLAQKY